MFQIKKPGRRDAFAAAENVGWRLRPALLDSSITALQVLMYWYRFHSCSSTNDPTFTALGSRGSSMNSMSSSSRSVVKVTVRSWTRACNWRASDRARCIVNEEAQGERGKIRVCYSFYDRYKCYCSLSSIYSYIVERYFILNLSLLLYIIYKYIFMQYVDMMQIYNIAYYTLNNKNYPTHWIILLRSTGGAIVR